MTPQPYTFARRALWALPLWAALLFLGTLTHQPDPQTAFADFAAYVTTGPFLLSHLVNSIAGAATGSIGAIGLMLWIQGTRAAGKGIAGMLATVTANTLTSSIFGVAAFAQPAMGQAFLAGEGNALGFYQRVYAAPLFLTALISLLLFIAGGVFLGMAMTASGRFPRWTGWAYAAGTIGFVLSNFLLPAGQSLTSVLLFLATGVAAWHANREGKETSRRTEVVFPSAPDA